MPPTDPTPPGGKRSRSRLSVRLRFPPDALRTRFAREPDLGAFRDRVDSGPHGRGIAFVSERDVPAIRRRLGLDSA